MARFRFHPAFLGLALFVLALAPRLATADEETTRPPSRVTAAFAEYAERVEAGEYANALGPAKRAYDYAQQDLAVDDDLLARTAAALGSLLLELDRPIDALRPLTHARELYDVQRGTASKKSRTMQRKVAEANRALGRYETAERTYLDLIERTKASDGDPTDETAAIYARLQSLTEEAGAQPRARRYGLQAMKLYRQSRGKESLPEGLVAVKLARGALEAGQWDDGLDLLEYGVPILEKRLEPGDPQLTVLYEFLIKVYSQVGDVMRERRYRVRLKKNWSAETKAAEKAEEARAEAEEKEAQASEAEEAQPTDPTEGS